MRRTSAALAVMVVVGLAVAVGALPGASGADDVETAVQARLAEFAKAWNAHDTKAMAAIWAEDGDIINPFGRVAKGRAEVEKLFASEHSASGAMRSSTFQVRSSTVRAVSSDVALLDAELAISGILGPDGRAMEHEFHLFVVDKKVGDGWFVFAGRPYLKPPPPGAPMPGGHPAPPK